MADTLARKKRVVQEGEEDLRHIREWSKAQRP